MTTKPKIKRIKLHPVPAVPRPENPPEGTLFPEKDAYYGALPICFYLGCVDLGRAKIGRKTHWITWGRNLTKEEIQTDRDNGFFATPVWSGAGYGGMFWYEYIIPDKFVEPLLGAIVK